MINTIINAINFIDDNIDSDISLDDVAKECNYSLSHLHNIFFRSIGQSLASYIREKKLEYAAKLLAFSDIKIMEIAVKCGYSSNEAFTRRFKIKYKQSPRKFRNDEMNKEIFRRLGKDRSQNLLKKEHDKKIEWLKAKTSTKMINIENVYKVNFFSGSNFAPEGFPFISCMSSVMYSLGAAYPINTTFGHNQEWRQRMGNIYFLGWSGIRFGLIWDNGWDREVCDVMLFDDQDKIIERSFNAAGREYQIITHNNMSEIEFKNTIKQSIDKGNPVIATGVIGPPEYCIITGYADDGDTIIGWNYFQNDNSFDLTNVIILPSGQFMKNDWINNTSSAIIIGEEKPIPDIYDLDKQTLNTAIRLATTYDINSLTSGHKAYNSWITQIKKDDGIIDVDTITLKASFNVHNMLIGILAETRAYAGTYLFDIEKNRYKNTEIGKLINQAAQHYDNIHSLMWEAWNVLGGNGNPDAYIMFADYNNREKIVGIIQKAKHEDINAIEFIKKTVKLM